MRSRSGRRWPRGWPAWVVAALAGLVAVSGAAGAAVEGSAGARTFLEGVAAYREGDYGAAAAAFERLAASGIRNPRLYYNLGNAHLKNGDLGPALLWYERALKLDPDDPDLNFNHAYARSLAKDEPEESRTASIYRILFFWRHLFSTKMTAALAVAFNALFWLVLMIRFLGGKKALKGIAYPLLMVVLILTATALYNQYEAAYIREGIVLPETVSVRSGLSEEATELFVLHAGAKVRIEQEKGDFFRIRFSEGKIGWVNRSRIGPV